MHAADPCTPSIFRDASRDDRKSPERRVMTWGERGAAPPQAWTHTSQRETSRRGSQQRGAAVALLTLHNIYYHGFVCDFRLRLPCGQPSAFTSLRLPCSWARQSPHTRNPHAGRQKSRAPQKAPEAVPSTNDARRYRPPAPQHVPREHRCALSALHRLAQVRRDARCRDGTV